MIHYRKPGANYWRSNLVFRDYRRGPGPDMSQRVQTHVDALITQPFSWPFPSRQPDVWLRGLTEEGS